MAICFSPSSETHLLPLRATQGAQGTDLHVQLLTLRQVHVCEHMRARMGSCMHTCTCESLIGVAPGISYKEVTGAFP